MKTKNAYTPAQEQGQPEWLLSSFSSRDQQSWGLKGPSQESPKEPYKDTEIGEEGTNKIKAGADIQFGCGKWFKLKQTGRSKETKTREEI